MSGPSSPTPGSVGHRSDASLPFFSLGPGTSGGMNARRGGNKSLSSNMWLHRRSSITYLQHTSFTRPWPRFAFHIHRVCHSSKRLMACTVRILNSAARSCTMRTQSTNEGPTKLPWPGFQNDLDIFIKCFLYLCLYSCVHISISSVLCGLFYLSPFARVIMTPASHVT